MSCGRNHKRRPEDFGATDDQHEGVVTDAFPCVVTTFLERPVCFYPDDKLLL